MEILNKEVIEATKKKFSEELENPVTLIFFTQEPSRLVLPEHLKGQECMFCKETRQLLEEVSSLSDKIKLNTYDFEGDKEKAKEYGIDKIPATVIMNEKDFGIRFFGIPSGYEYASLIETIIDPTCPYCPMAVRLGHQFALESPFVKSEMVESTEFPHLAQKYNVFGVPKTVVNETVFIEGAVPEDTFLEHVLKAQNPAEKK